MPTPPPNQAWQLPTLLQWVVLLLAAGTAGQLLVALHIPAGHFLGPMGAAIALAVSGFSVRLPEQSFEAGQSVIGLLAAHSISASVLLSLVQSWPVMLLATTCTIALSLLVGVAVARYGDLPGTTAIWGSAPGAASAMISLGESYGADGRIVATMQYVRVVCVVVTGALVSHLISDPDSIPTASLVSAGPIDWHWLSFLGCLAVIAIGTLFSKIIPAGALLIPLVLGAILQLSGLMQIIMPSWFTAMAMGAIGCYVGLRFDRQTTLYVVKRLPTMVLCSMLLIIVCAALAYGISKLLNKDYLSVYLATSPGGLDSMAIIAVDSNADISLVLAMQAMRLFTVILIGPFLVKRVIVWTTH